MLERNENRAYIILLVSFCCDIKLLQCSSLFSDVYDTYASSE